MSRVQVGECPKCGYVVKENIDFPNSPTCECGEELTRATVASEEKVRRKME